MLAGYLLSCASLCWDSCTACGWLVDMDPTKVKVASSIHPTVPTPSDVHKALVGWLPHQNNWSEVVIMQICAICIRIRRFKAPVQMHVGFFMLGLAQNYRLEGKGIIPYILTHKHTWNPHNSSMNKYREGSEWTVDTVRWWKRLKHKGEEMAMTWKRTKG